MGMLSSRLGRPGLLAFLVLIDVSGSTSMIAAGRGAVRQGAVILGGGPAGLATAIMLAQRGRRDIHVYDRLEAPPDPNNEALWSDTSRFYLIGLGARGQAALQKLGVWEDVARYTSLVDGRKDWSPGAGVDEGVERIFTDRPVLTQVLARDRLAGALVQVLQERYTDAVQLHYGVECAGASWNSVDGEDISTLNFTPCAVRPQMTEALESDGCELKGEVFHVTTPFLIGADGASRTVAEALETSEKGQLRGIRVTKFKDDNVRVYKTIPFELPDGWRRSLDYSARTKDGRVIFDALPANEDGSFCGVILLREADEFARANSDPAGLRELLDSLLPQFSPLIADAELQRVAVKPPSRLPEFRFVGPRLHKGSSTVLLGDAVHTVKPYFGLGANSALEDVTALADALDKADDQAAALASFSQARAGEAEALVRLSHGFDRPGTFGLLCFVVPLILDGIFHKLFPQIFGPNTLAMLQRPQLSFRGVMWRKRKDRLLQVLVLSLVFFGIGAATRTGLWALAAVPGTALQKGSFATLAAALWFTGSKIRSWLTGPARHMAPADAKAAWGWGKGNESLLMQQRMGQKGYGKTADSSEPAAASA